MKNVIGAWMLSQTSVRVLSTYGRNVLFFAAYHIVTWTLVDVAVAWRIRPRQAAQAVA